MLTSEMLPLSITRSLQGSLSSVLSMETWTSRHPGHYPEATLKSCLVVQFCISKALGFYRPQCACVLHVCTRKYGPSVVGAWFLPVCHQKSYVLYIYHSWKVNPSMDLFRDLGDGVLSGTNLQGAENTIDRGHIHGWWVLLLPIILWPFHICAPHLCDP